MDHLAILYSIRNELNEIITNYNNSLRHIESKHKSTLNETDPRYKEMEETCRYGILIYGTALQVTEHLIREQTIQ